MELCPEPHGAGRFHAAPLAHKEHNSPVRFGAPGSYKGHSRTIAREVSVSEHHEHHVPADLQPVVSRLLDKAAYADPLELDRGKQRVLARLRSHRGPRWSLRSRLVTVLAIAGFAASSGGAIALASSGSTGAQGGASIGQYCRRHDRDHGHCEHHPYHCHLKHHDCKHEHHEDHVHIKRKHHQH